jgi:uncharacterized membrane protein (DUF4010 family)
MASTMLLLCFMITILFVAIMYKKLIDKQSSLSGNDKNELSLMDKQILIEQHIVKIFSFPFIVDSKFIGLIIFLLSNLLTGLVNLTVNTLAVDNLYSFFILNAYAFVAYFLPYLAYYHYYHYKNKKNE